MAWWKRNLLCIQKTWQWPSTCRLDCSSSVSDKCHCASNEQKHYRFKSLVMVWIAFLLRGLAPANKQVWFFKFDYSRFLSSCTFMHIMHKLCHGALSLRRWLILTQTIGPARSILSTHTGNSPASQVFHLNFLLRTFDWRCWGLNLRLSECTACALTLSNGPFPTWQEYIYSPIVWDYY